MRSGLFTLAMLSAVTYAAKQNSSTYKTFYSQPTFPTLYGSSKPDHTEKEIEAQIDEFEERRDAIDNKIDQQHSAVAALVAQLTAYSNWLTPLLDDENLTGAAIDLLLGEESAQDIEIADLKAQCKSLLDQVNGLLTQVAPLQAQIDMQAGANSMVDLQSIADRLAVLEAADQVGAVDQIEADIATLQGSIVDLTQIQSDVSAIDLTSVQSSIANIQGQLDARKIENDFFLVNDTDFNLGQAGPNILAEFCVGPMTTVEFYLTLTVSSKPDFSGFVKSVQLRDINTAEVYATADYSIDATGVQDRERTFELFFKGEFPTEQALEVIADIDAGSVQVVEQQKLQYGFRQWSMYDLEATPNTSCI